MNRRFLKVCRIALLISLSVSFIAYPKASSSLKDESLKRAEFHDAMRKLWEDHITWTRVFIISADADLPDKATATNRLLQNQVDKEVVARLHGDWTGDVAAFDAVHQQILHLADGLSMGIINQLPTKFE